MYVSFVEDSAKKCVWVQPRLEDIASLRVPKASPVAVEKN